MGKENAELVSENDRYLEAVINRKNQLIPIETIKYIESRGRKIVLHLDNGEKMFYSKMCEIEEKMINNGFIRVHQSFMVRISDVSKVSRTSIRCEDVEVPISRRYYGKIRKTLGIDTREKIHG